MDTNSFLIVIVFVLVIVIVLAMIFPMNKNKDSFVWGNKDYQYFPPNIETQDDYYDCILKECGGNTYDFACLEACHIKSFRKNLTETGPATWDAQTWVCGQFSDKDSFYKCLDRVYSDYRVS